MQLIATEAIRGSHALNDVVREMSLSLSFFSDPAKFAVLMAGPPRRIVLLTDSDICEDIVEQLRVANSSSPVGVIIAADRPKLRSSEKLGLIDKLVELPNVEWVGAEFDFDRLAASARHCRRRMLKVSRTDLHRAFENSEFFVQYQPKVERDTGADWVTREAEALIRWRHPEHGVIGPLEFLPEIEAFGMMADLTEFVLRTAAAQLQEWHEQDLDLNGCINLAPSLLNDQTLGERFAAIVNEYGVACERFTFELVEQELANPEAPHLIAINGLREKGFRLSLDDFRVAAASLSTFEKLPFDEIKIHASALRDAKHNTASLHVLAAVAGLAHNLGMSVCAEGVEDEEMFNFLAMIQCDKMQGFMISEAVLPHIIKRAYSAKETSSDVA
ncbi:MAG: EAL domain-containing protein [Gammaproteobacteria bacterium]|nr:EAL domain-containing protein [Gammaproteobacteria bacterium]